MLFITTSLNSVCANEHDDKLFQEQQNAVIKKSNQLLPNLFKDKPEHKISLDGGVIITDKANKSEIIDGAGMSIKVKTGQ